MERIEKVIGHNSTCSRQEIKKLIRERRVYVNDVCITKPGIQVDPAKDRIRVDDTIIDISGQDKIVLLNKPCGYITSRHDPSGYPSVFDLLPEQDRNKLHAVGRLDVDSCGLLLFVSDGALTHRLTHPKHHIEKEYIVTLDRTLTDDAQHMIQTGIMLDGDMTKPCRMFNITQNNGKTSLHIILQEGKHRQIRRMFDRFDMIVTFLERIRMGDLVLGELPEGQLRTLSDQERAQLISGV
jgi:23S rRNA pseudouridine2605 synthase